MSKCAQCGKEHAGDGVLCLQCWTTNQAKPKAYTETCVECGRQYQETSQLSCVCPSCRQAAKHEVAFTVPRLSKPPTEKCRTCGRDKGYIEPDVVVSGCPECHRALEPPFQQFAMRICRVCGLEYPETPCLQTHVCHACRLPALGATKCAKCRWEFAPREHPCLSCKHWLPSGPAAELGAGMCTRRDVPCHDFSCFRPKEG